MKKYLLLVLLAVLSLYSCIDPDNDSKQDKYTIRKVGVIPEDSSKIYKLYHYGGIEAYIVVSKDGKNVSITKY